VVDNLGTPDMTPPPTNPIVEVAEKRPGFLSTTMGKLVVGGIVIIVVLGAVAAISVLFFLGRATNDATDGGIVPVQQSGGTESASGDASATPRPEPSLQDTFAFRNIFQPTIKVTLTSTTDDADGGTGSGTSVDVPNDTLYLAGVSTEDGDLVAELIWNDQTYMLREGESIAGTPWQVLSISGDTVVMLFGDSRVTLTVGQGISK
jgi:hypothetical protein